MAKRSEIRLAVVTPERQVLSEAVDSCVIPAHDGEVGILNQRAPLMCELGIGKLSYRQSGKSHSVYIDGGFAQVHHNQVTVLTSQAYTADEITDSVVSDVQKAAAAATGATLSGMQTRGLVARRTAALGAVRQSR